MPVGQRIAARDRADGIGQVELKSEELPGSVGLERQAVERLEVKGGLAPCFVFIRARADPKGP